MIYFYLLLLFTFIFTYKKTFYIYMTFNVKSNTFPLVVSVWARPRSSFELLSLVGILKDSEMEIRV